MQSAPLRPRQSPLLPSQSSLFLATRARKFCIHHFGSGAPLQAIKAEMDSAEDEFTPLSQLTDDTEKCTVRVRISRLWESFHPKNNILFGLDSLLIDDQGETMQARVLPSDIHLFEERLVEGKIYALSDFTVQETREDYMNCSNEWTIYFGSETVVNEIEGDIDSIPLHSFEFINFKDLRSRRDNNSLLSDVLGRIVYVGKLYVSKKSRHKKICDATIQNLSGRELNVTLYGDVACGFAEDMLEKGLEASVVAVFAGMRVDSSHLVCSTASSKYYLDMDIPEVQDFCAKLRIQQANPVPEKSSAQKLAESWRTIKQLKGLDPEEYDDDTKFLCRVSLIDIDCTSGWCYPGCIFCNKSLGRKSRCSRCGPVKKPIQMYKLKAKVEDSTGRMNLMIFCEVAEELVGVSAEELTDEIEEDDDWYNMPKQIEDLLGSTHTFQVFDKYGDGSFSVWSIMDDVSVPVAAATTSERMVEPVPEVEEGVQMEDPSLTTTKRRKESVRDGSAATAEARSKSTRLRQPNKRLRGDVLSQHLLVKGTKINPGSNDTASFMKI